MDDEMNIAGNADEEFQMQERLALLYLLQLSQADVEAGNVRDSEEVFNDIRRLIAEKRTGQK